MQHTDIMMTAEDYFGKFHCLDNFLDMKDGFEEYRHWSGHFSSGFFYLIKLKPGLILTIANHQSNTPLSIAFEKTSTCFNLSFFLSSAAEARYLNQSIPENPIAFGSAQSFLSYTPGCRGIMNLRKTVPYCVIGICMRPGLLERFWDEHPGGGPDEVHDVLYQSASRNCYHRSLKITPVIDMRLHEILACPYQGGTKRFYLESKVLELMVLALSQLESNTTGSAACFAFPPEREGFVQEARDIMIKNMINPPSLSELSRQVGVNKKKLNRSFRRVYGTSIFDYLRTCRLEKARELLQHGQTTVTEVAFAVGYAQQRTFSKEFKKYFGKSPRAFSI